MKKLMTAGLILGLITTTGVAFADTGSSASSTSTTQTGSVCVSNAKIARKTANKNAREVFQTALKTARENRKNSKVSGKGSRNSEQNITARKTFLDTYQSAKDIRNKAIEATKIKFQTDKQACS